MMTRKCILIAEDDASILKMTKLRLEHEGYAVRTAIDGDTALQVLVVAGAPVDLVRLDIRLPKRSGYDVCRAIKREPATAGIPVIVFSASETQIQQLADRCIEVGATDWIKKPFRTTELLAKIHRALGEGGEEHG
jgi:DNA-binding response OmpR family regulator